MPTPAVRPRAARLPAPVRREQILDAAIEVFARSGYRDAGTAVIAARLGVSEPTLFRHFPTKRALYLAAIDRSAEVLIGRWRELAAAAPTALAALFAVGEWYFGELARDSRHLLLRFRSYGETADVDVADRVRRHFVTVFDLVLELFTRARDAGELATGEPRAQAWLFMAIGGLLDTTQILGLRDMLRLEEMPAIMQLAMPPATASTSTRRRRPRGRSTSRRRTSR
jgi:AcrR family transcriptional regulator